MTKTMSCAILAGAACLPHAAWAQAAATQSASTDQTSTGTRSGEIIVIGQRDEGHDDLIVTGQSTGSKANVPITDVPQSIAIVPYK